MERPFQKFVKRTLEYDEQNRLIALNDISLVYEGNKLIWIEFMSPDVDDYSFLMCCGRNTRHLVKSQRIETDGYIVYFNYKYELDSKGRPVTIYEEWKDSYGGTHNYTYKLSYK